MHVCLRDARCRPFGCGDENPILNTRMYEVEYADGYKALMSVNLIAQNLFTQVDEEGNRHVLFEEIGAVELTVRRSNNKMLLSLPRPVQSVDVRPPRAGRS